MHAHSVVNIQLPITPSLSHYAAPFYSPHFYGHSLLHFHLLQTNWTVLLRPVLFVLQISSTSLKDGVHVTFVFLLSRSSWLTFVLTESGFSLTSDTHTSCSASLEHRVHWVWEIISDLLEKHSAYLNVLIMDACHSGLYFTALIITKMSFYAITGRLVRDSCTPDHVWVKRSGRDHSV